MKANRTIRTVDDYILKGCGRCDLFNTPLCKVNKWREILVNAREIILKTNLKEELKWKQPCYTFDEKNILLLSAFKNFVAISFFKGTLLKDKSKILTSPGENSQFVKQIRITSLTELEKYKNIILSYIKEAIKIEKNGKQIQKQKSLNLPIELENKFIENPQFQSAFFALTPGRRRAYIIYFSQPKKSETRIARIEKCVEKILQGKGINE